jgi:hypothetical protein
MNGMNDADLAGLRPLRRQAIWNMLRDEWGRRPTPARGRAACRRHYRARSSRGAGAAVDLPKPEKRLVIYEHVYESYWGDGKSKYADGGAP